LLAQVVEAFSTLVVVYVESESGRLNSKGSLTLKIKYSKKSIFKINLKKKKKNILE